VVEEMLSTKQVAQQYGIYESTLRYYRHRGVGPASFPSWRTGMTGGTRASWPQ